MESNEYPDDCSSMLSPTDSASSPETQYHKLKAVSFDQDDNVNGGDANTSLPSSHLDFLNLIFPPTPEQSPNDQSCDDQEFATDTTKDAIESIATEKAVEVPEIIYLRSSIAENDLQYHGQDQQIESSVEIEMAEVGALLQMESITKEDSGYLKDKSKPKRSLTFPPCVICSGKASGSHYGAITCEACKGFFRRYLQKKGEYKCTKGGKCEIINRNRGNCSGCRLTKCLLLGMSKEKSKLGRYTLTRRTEAIKHMNKMEGKETTDSFVEANEVFPVVNEGGDSAKYDPESEMIGRKISQNGKNLNVSNGFSKLLVSELVQAMLEIKPFGRDITTKEQIVERHRFHAERYKQKIQLFGRMNTVPKDEYYKLYKEFGIDVDGRMADMKICCKDMEGIVERYCNFAKHIPGFHSLPYKDQSSLLKVSRADFFIIIMSESYSKEYNTYLGQDGIGYHVEEMADKFLSRELLDGMCTVYTRWQDLELSEEEKAVIGAMTLLFTDRCKLENYAHVEKIQLALAELIRTELMAKDKTTAQRRFTKIIDSLTAMRTVSELYLKEYNLMCKDDVLTQELPMLSEFFLEEYDNVEKK
ncbi:vitamin D3 receptor-like [Mercenaria mercenaria]|uniref:vitamin D3 receptor-like n=1 Tax=Mercenaria mercenaria TaxID=6596 RepID=UPI00234F4011|nr:vitamin D3 receptor-like [Mercenaria mercenaria]XP_045171740.2 vitamin D3 receptor-like [Mercenaria mercenaria]XP_045171742.2 vitamin D3 receptor-like [Mercenaria mercenaria]